jgi:predicted ATPase
LLAPPLSPLVDRTQELESIRVRLVVEGVGPLTLCGAAGVGKTRRALAAATELAYRLSARVVPVDLASVRDLGMVLPALSRALGLSYAGGVPLLERLRLFLEGRATLLPLDKFE